MNLFQTSSAFTRRVTVPAPWQETGRAFPQSNFRDLACVSFLPIEGTSDHQPANLVSLSKDLKLRRASLGLGGEAQCPFASIRRVMQAPCASSERPQLYPPEIQLCAYTPPCTPEKTMQKGLVLHVGVLKTFGATPLFWPMEMMRPQETLPSPKVL